MPEETRTSDGRGISHMTEVECRKEADGTEKRLHLGYSSEGFHAAVTAKAGGPFDWGKAYPEAKPALDAVWNTGPDSERMEGSKMAEIPEHLKAQADAVREQTGAQQYPVKDMGGAPATDSTTNQSAKLEISRDQKPPEPEPDKG
jgi:hypothetical protein